MTAIDDVLRHLDEQEPATRARYFDFLRIPSVSAQPRHAADCRLAADWLVRELTELGFQASVRDTAGHPVVVAHHPGPGGDAPHLLYYGHYDVQPAEPLELWTSPPFEPTVVPGPNGERVVARGAVDDKGQVMTWLAALRAWQAVAGGPPARITALIEGEEEVGSPSLDAFLQANAEELRAAIAIVSDTNQWDPQTPAVSTRLRGMVYAQIDLRAASRDLHSGMYGGAARNPLNLLSRILADLHDDDGRVQIPGFYDGVTLVSNAQAAQWDALRFDEAAFLGDVGLSVPAGERGLGALERLWARPTCDVNGIWGGYTGEGSKTVIAAEAHAKLSCRLVGQQDPQAVAEGLRRFVAERLPKDVTAEVQIFSTASPIEVSSDSPYVAAATTVLSEEFGRAPALIGCGGSIPVVESFRRILGMDALLMGFGLNDDQVHSPNEKFDWNCLVHGARSHARLLGALGRVS
ncbi:dipeptidase [Roseomonas sp. BN140053]|uniref:dipeptidase n=1 Tax=Roseomonas sp. BN140053 TaxID=3391898 RepID=UPI0039EB260F